MLTTIVTGVDDSEPAANAARKAAALAQVAGARLYVLTAYERLEIDRITSGSDEFIVTTEADALRTASDVAAMLRSAMPDLDVVPESAQGKPADALVRAAERLEADVIVVGNKRVQGISRVLGSIARDVASRAACDVYIAHTHPR